MKENWLTKIMSWNWWEWITTGKIVFGIKQDKKE